MSRGDAPMLTRAQADGVSTIEALLAESPLREGAAETRAARARTLARQLLRLRALIDAETLA